MSEKKFFGHPIQLSTLFHIELWERFSFYGMKGILMIYLYYAMTDGGLGLDKAIAGGIVGAYGGSVYLSSILGGWFADRVFGAERTLFYSGIVVMLGHIAMAILPGLSGLLCGMVLIALGSGGVKASATSMVGALYETEQWRPFRDAGFSIFYISINIGGFFGPLVTGLLQENAGFHWAFGAAAIGMAFGLWRYSLGRASLPKTPVPNPLSPSQVKIAVAAALGIVAVLGIAIASNLLNLDNFSNILFIAVCIISALYFLRLFTDSEVANENKRYIAAYVPLFATIAAFWSVWFQIYTVVIVYFDETMNRTIGGFTIPVAWAESLQSFWVISFSGLLATLWTKLGKKQPKTPLKFALAMLILGVSYLVFVPYVGNGIVMPLIVFALTILGITIAELFLSPVSLSFITKIAPAKFKTQMPALNFLALSLGFTFGGILFKNYYQAENPQAFFVLISSISFVCGAIVLVLTPMLNRLLKGAE